MVDVKTKTAQDFKNAGNNYVKKGRYSEARAAYDEGLNITCDDMTRRDLFRNRALANLNLERYDSAKHDAIESLSQRHNNDHFNSKAYYRAARAAYGLRDFDTARKYLMEQQALAPCDDGNSLLLKVDLRLAEQQYGCHEFAQLIDEASLKGPRVDGADFIHRTEVKESEGRGRGLFAAQDFRLGDLVLCEKAFSAAFEFEGKNGLQALIKEVALKIMRNQSTIPKLATICDQSQDLYPARIKTNDRLIADAVRRNAFSIPTPTLRMKELYGLVKDCGSRIGENAAVFLHASMLNHDCLPNARRVFIGDMIVLRAVRSIAFGEEITISYIAGAGADERQSMIERAWKFKCDCDMCVAELKHTVEERRSFAKLEMQSTDLAHELMKNLPESAQWDEEIERGEKLVADNYATYDPEIDARIPHMAASFLRCALAHVYYLRKDNAKCIAVVVEAFTCLGWDLLLNDDEQSVQLLSKDNAHINEDAMSLLIVASKVKTSEDRHEMAEQLDKLAKNAYVAWNGAEVGFKV